MEIWSGRQKQGIHIQNFCAETYGNIEENDLKMDLMEIGCGGGRRVEGAQGRI